MAGPKNKPLPELRLESDESGGPAAAANGITRVVSEFLVKRLNAGAAVCVALSGGRDSVVLLHLLQKLLATGAISANLSAIHVHHGLSPNADAWATFCADTCQRLGVPLQVVRVEVARHGGEGLEAAARRARHTAFAGCAADWLALAHHRDDQAETVMLNLLRGSGVAGAAGMLPERAQTGAPVLIRPLLNVPRGLIERYAAEAGLSWISDESNDDTHFRRNFLRREVFPRLDDRFPGARQSLARAAGHFAECRHLLDELATLDRATLTMPSGRVSLAGWNALSPPRVRNLLRFLWCESGFRAPDMRWVDEAIGQLATAGTDSQLCLSTADGELHVYRGELYFLPPQPQEAIGSVPWLGEPELAWGNGRVRFLATTGAGIRQDLLLPGEVFLKARQGGERLRPDANRPRRSLRNLLQESAIPPWRRTRLPYLWANNQLVWVSGVGCDADWQARAGQAGILPEFDL